MNKNKAITILAIETSCDDTGIAIIRSQPKAGSFEILSNIVSSQTKVHEQYGGVFPMMAKREHQKNLVPVLTESLKTAGLLSPTEKEASFNFSELKEILNRENNLYESLVSFLQKYEIPNIDLIAVTNGPGLEPCLWAGVNLAKALSSAWGKPLSIINHIQAHILANFIENDISKIKFPAICLVVSGGHTQIVLMKNLNKYKIIGETRDDAAGECFDKTARILNLGYPGGPAIAKEALKLNGKFVKKLPRPMINTKDYDFSFSGLKTAVLYDHMRNPNNQKPEYITNMAADIQQAVIDILIKKTLNAVIDYKAKTIILGGGVTANQELRKQLAEKIKEYSPKTQYLTPKPEYCTDNGLMIAASAFLLQKKNKPKKWQKVEAEANLRLE